MRSEGPTDCRPGAAGIGVAFVPVLSVSATALFPRQSWQALTLEALLSIAGVRGDCPGRREADHGKGGRQGAF